MYTSLTGLARHAVIDSSCLINASVLSDSPSRVAITYLRKLGFCPVVSDEVLAEAKNKIQQLGQRAGVPFNSGHLITRFITDSGIVLLPDQPNLRHIDSVNKKDQPVARAAVHCAGWILTGDLPLVSECRMAGIEARLPHDVIGHYMTDGGTENPPLSLLFSACYPVGPEMGFLFIRLQPDQVGSRSGMIRTAVHVEGLGWLRYVEDDQEWRFSLEGQDSVGLSTPFPAGVLETLLVNLRAGDRIELRVGSVREPSIAPLASGEPLPSGRRVRAGLHGGTKYPLAGSILRIASGPYCISKDRWKVLREHATTAPEPWEEGLAVKSLSRIAHKWHNHSSVLGYLLPSTKDFWK